MEELKQKMDLILESQILVQSSVIKLSNKIDALDKKFEVKFEETNQKITDLQEGIEKDTKDIADMFNTVFQHIPA